MILAYHFSSSIEYLLFTMSRCLWSALQVAYSRSTHTKRDGIPPKEIRDPNVASTSGAVPKATPARLGVTPRGVHGAERGLISRWNRTRALSHARMQNLDS